MDTSSVYQQVKQKEEELAHFLHPFFARHDSLRAALKYTTVLLSRVDRKNTWHLAEESGVLE